MQDGADSLRHNDHRGGSRFLVQRPPKAGVRPVIQGGKTVVKQVYSRVLCNGPGNGQPLFLSAGHIGAALGHRAVISFRLLRNKLLCLGHPRRFFHGFITNPVFSGQLKVGSNGSGKEDSLLGHQADQFPQPVLGNLTDIDSVQGNPSGRHIVKPRDQVDQRGFAAAGTADDGRGLSGFCRKGNMLQHIPVRSRIVETHVFKAHHPPAGGKPVVQNLRIIVDGRLRIEHLFDSVRRHTGPWQHDGNHGKHQKGHDDLHGIGHKGHHIPHLQIAGIDSLCAEPDDHHCDPVHNQHHHRHHKIHHPVGKQLGFHQIGVGLVKPLFLELFPGKGADDQKARKDFPGDKVHPVHQLLHDFEFGHGDIDQRQDKDKNRCHRHRNDPPHPGPGPGHFDNSAQSQDRRVDNHTQKHDGNHLHLLDIVGAPGNQGGGGKLVHLPAGKGHDPFKHPLPEVFADGGRGPGRQKADENGSGHHHQGKSQHLCPGPKQVSGLNSPHIPSHGFILCLHEGNRHLVEHGITGLAHAFQGRFAQIHDLVFVHAFQPLHQARKVRLLHGLPLPGNQHHGNPEGALDLFLRLFPVCRPSKDAVLRRLIPACCRPGLLVRHPEAKRLPRFAAHFLRRCPGNPSLLDAHVHNIRSILGQGQVAPRLDNQQYHNGYYRFFALF